MKEQHQFTCSCNAIPLPYSDFRKHLHDVHKMRTNRLLGRKEKVQSDKHTFVKYQWTLTNGLTFHETYKLIKHKSSLKLEAV